jgi:hypothetical protein
VGAALSGGLNSNGQSGGTGGNDDWAFYGKIGFVYRLPDAGPLLEPSAALVLSGLGKTFNTLDEFSAFPSIVTPQAGFSATVLSTRNFKAGFSLDLSFPSAQNIVIDTGLQAEIAQVFLVSAGYQVNVSEAAAAKEMHWPFIGISYNFTANTERSRMLAARGWLQNDMRISGVWESRASGNQLMSAGAVVNMGNGAAQAPQIIIED